MESLLVSSGLFKGRDLTDELAFVRYFHNHPLNVALHQLGLVLSMAGVFLVLSPVRTGGIPAALVLTGSEPVTP